ncbi:hypothetical protein NQ317_010902 [Molorchus minor]|uniref:Uncharacterized protein n=1 Tax=Molorchus minor TaxID=1323400 RepID=A0ABQ9JPI1_9CUCU|nr:hypothetical protein NQ317_010902 [Molorchus minor]
MLYQNELKSPPGGNSNNNNSRVGSRMVKATAELTIEQLKKLATYRKECMAETGVKEEVVRSASRGVIADDPKLNEHLLCVFKKAGFSDGAGQIQKEVIKQKLTDVIRDADLAESLVNSCVLQMETPQLTSLESYRCFYEKTNIPVV